MSNDPLRPLPTLLCKLGSIVVHAEEFLSPRGHPVDKAALDDLLKDPEVRAWLDDMGREALVPVKREDA